MLNWIKSTFYGIMNQMKNMKLDSLWKVLLVIGMIVGILSGIGIFHYVMFYKCIFLGIVGAINGVMAPIDASLIAISIIKIVFSELIATLCAIPSALLLIICSFLHFIID